MFPQSEDRLPIEDIINRYNPSLIAYPSLVKEFSQLAREIPSEIPILEIQKNAALLTIWPFIEAYNIALCALNPDTQLCGDDEKKLLDLNEKFNANKDSQDTATIKEKLLTNCSIKLENYQPYERTEGYLLSKLLSLDCEPLKEHLKKTPKGRQKMTDDVLMGGSHYIFGMDPDIPTIGYAKYSFMSRMFLCVDYEQKPFLFMDTIESGDPAFNILDHWRGTKSTEDTEKGTNRLHHLYATVASAMYIAECLDVSQIVLRDFELVEFSRALGMRERKMFDKNQDYKKIGLHSKQTHSGIYTHSLYRTKTEMRFNVLQRPTLRSAADMLDALEGHLDSIVELNSTRIRKPHRLTDAYRNAFDILARRVLALPYTRTDQLDRTVELMAEKDKYLSKFHSQKNETYINQADIKF